MNVIATSDDDRVLREQESHEQRVVEEHANERLRDITERNLLNDRSLGEFEGEVVSWGDLSLADRKAYLNGGFPF